MATLIDINKLKVVPDNQKKNDGLELCVYGPLPEDIQEWLNFHALPNYIVGNYTNIVVPNNVRVENLFVKKPPYQYMDGFSPNLNKYLHIGHFSNLVIAKAIKSLGMCKSTVSIYGDTLQGEVKKEDALKKLTFYFDHFNYFPDAEFLASQMELKSNLLVDGEGEFEGCKVFMAGDQPIVGIKSDGSTSYFYQDVCLAEQLNDSTLYLTGSEQENHFAQLKKIIPHIDHLPLGLVKVNGKKMSSREGNVIFLDDMLKIIADKLSDETKSNVQLIYNIFAGLILRTSPESDKNVDLNLLDNVKASPGLYVSYTMARLASAGVLEFINGERFPNRYFSQELELLNAKACNLLRPSILFEGLVEHCNKINSLYTTNTIKGNVENLKMFRRMLMDLMKASQRLGLFFIEKV